MEVTASQQRFVPQVRGSHLRQRPEIHPSLLRGQGSCHGAQDRCPENGPGGSAPRSWGGWVGEGGQRHSLHGRDPSPSALHQGVWWGSCRSHPGDPAQHVRQWPALPAAAGRGGLRWGCPTPSCPIPPFQYICRGPSSLATSRHSLLLQVFYNNKGYHSMPTYLNALNNAILRANLPKSKGNPAAYGEDPAAFKGRSTSGTALGHNLTSAMCCRGPSRLLPS